MLFKLASINNMVLINKHINKIKIIIKRIIKLNNK